MVSGTGWTSASSKTYSCNVRQAQGITRKANAAERVASALRKAIVSGEIAPGDYIRQEQWAAQLNVSRLPVREALKELASEGLLNHHANKGYCLARLDLDEMSQIYLMRQLLEPELIKTVRWPAEKELRDFRKIAEKSEAALDRQDAVTCLNCERLIDYKVYELSRLKVVAREVKRLWELLDPYRYLVVAEPRAFDPEPKTIRDRHRMIIEALEAQDHSALRDGMALSFEPMLALFHRPPFISPELP